jgi:hypothetical protein
MLGIPTLRGSIKIAERRFLRTGKERGLELLMMTLVLWMLLWFKNCIPKRLKMFMVG